MVKNILKAVAYAVSVYAVIAFCVYTWSVWMDNVCEKTWHAVVYWAGLMCVDMLSVFGLRKLFFKDVDPEKKEA